MEDLQELVSCHSTMLLERTSKVSWDGTIELEKLVVPSCPEHGMMFMRFAREEDSKSVMDFQALKDWVTDVKAIGAVGSCIACSRSYGRIIPRPAPLHVPISLAKPPPEAAQKKAGLISAIRDKARSTVNTAMAKVT